MRDGPASVMGNRYVKRTDTTKIQNWEINNLDGTSMSQYLPTGNFVEIEVTEKNESKLLISILYTKDDHKHGYFKE